MSSSMTFDGYCRLCFRYVNFNQERDFDEFCMNTVSLESHPAVVLLVIALRGKTWKSCKFVSWEQRQHSNEGR
jgi:hypothetical protein